MPVQDERIRIEIVEELIFLEFEVVLFDCLLYVDKFFAMMAVYKLVEEHQYQSYKYMIPLGLLLMIDTIVARKKQICHTHVAWHFGAALIAFIALLNK